MFFKTVAAKNFAIFTGKNLWWSLFLIKNVFISTLSQTRLQHRWFLSCENCGIFTNTFFLCNISGSWAAFVSLIKNCSIMGICRSSLLNHKHNRRFQSLAALLNFSSQFFAVGQDGLWPSVFTLKNAEILTF